MNYLQQYQFLRDSLPRAAIAQINHENSTFCNYVDRVKDCYLITSALEDERCFYCRNIFYNLDCVDCIDTHNSELCYECVGIKKSYNLNFCYECEQCTDSEYLYECKSCSDCFCCVNLHHKQFHIFNQPYSKKDYKEIVQKLKQAISQSDNQDQNHTLGRSHIFQEFLKLKLLSPHIAIHGLNNENSIGDFLFNTQNLYNCFESKESRDCLYSYEMFKCEDSTDIHISEFGKLNYDCVSAYKDYNCNFCYNCWESTNLEYCEQCFQCQDCMFCVYLSHKRFHIFNKPYSEEEYSSQKAQILAEMRALNTYGKHIDSTYPIGDTVAA